MRTLSKTKFEQCHYKILLIDNKFAIIGTGNLDVESFDGTKTDEGSRDFAVKIFNKNTISDLENLFNTDWEQRTINVKNPNLVLGPDNQRTKLLSLINSAKKSIYLYQQDITDQDIFNALLKALNRNVLVKIIMTPFPFNKNKDYNEPNQKKIKKAGGELFLIKKLYIHAKVLLIDYGTLNEKSYIGSCNFYTPSINKNRELGIIITQKNIPDSLIRIIKLDCIINQ